MFPGKLPVGKTLSIKSFLEYHRPIFMTSEWQETNSTSKLSADFESEISNLYIEHSLSTPNHYAIALTTASNDLIRF